MINILYIFVKQELLATFAFEYYVSKQLGFKRIMVIGLGLYQEFQYSNMTHW